MAFDGVVVVPYAVAVAALVDAVLIPVFYSCDFTVAYRRLMMGGSVLFFGAVLLLEMLPESVKEWLFGIEPTLSPAAWAGWPSSSPSPYTPPTACPRASGRVANCDVPESGARYCAPVSRGVGRYGEWGT